MANSNKKKSRPAPAKKSQGKSSAFKGLAAVLVVTAALSYNFVKDYVTDLGLLLGEVQSLNTAGCAVVPGLEACEDIHLLRGPGLAFLTCGSAEARKGWYPPVAHLNATTENAFEDRFIVYNIESKDYESLELTGLPENTDRVFHGIDAYERSPTEYTFFLVNHRRGGSVVEIFDYTLGEKAVRYVETIKHDLIQTPNDIVATGPRSFYVSNDHRHHKGGLRVVEENTFVALDQLASANGMTTNNDRSVLFVSECYGAAMAILDRRDDNTLVRKESVKLDFFNDNPSFEPESGEVFVTGHVQPLKMAFGLTVPIKPVEAPSKVVKLTKKKGEAKTSVQTVFLDNGKLLSTGTMTVVDRKRDVMLLTGVFSTNGLVRCSVPVGV
ncbi:hypothetical protein BGW38_001886 [Lunasporangiospora selenospora]|uniref:Arylesterase n=1 Tax=Lunasporangiospora selenospora TaxID=979761 RepID=A0A9P6KHY2_9FUNG|nr:hypothetical protein BGW38_001886 [Lunasporangiospora selenospora]